MGHKVHPKIHRIPTIYSWDSKWFAKGKSMPLFLEQEVGIRDFLTKKLKESLIDGISIERTPKDLTVYVLAAKPGTIIGRGGQGLEDLRKHIERKILQQKLKVKINILEVRNPALSAMIVAQNAAGDIEKRFPFRRVMKQLIERVMSAGAQGVKVCMSGRLNGVEIARTEKLAAGKMSLITLRSDVDYANYEAQTLYGKIGIKVWIYKGEAFSRRDKFAKKEDEVKPAVTTKEMAKKPAVKKEEKKVRSKA
ncbi:MAG: 30S ribosomal protein S3 [Candidatus Magasanikbacteria bacterium GW2011_GWA2_40_10]|uniref:Small ribosomal subunit protein uS3 n=1 Tax=Candidatus Magasanikbacteria bacterium GW2011_GWA2_40_10 TaxID=1619037 RepID=A0A0G0SK78_9BACT|nr:MAG: 30S ribosomal protein S3 [Candidatus Magasanikbacteria bacterium GW2011_GWA2_40_10]